MSMQQEDMQDLMIAFMLKATYWHEMGQQDRANGIGEFVDHIADYINFDLGGDDGRTV